MKLRAIRNHIIFQFVDRVTSTGRFTPERSHGGIHLLANNDDSAKEPRWVKVISAGPDCSEQVTQPNVELLVDALRWTAGAKFEDQTYWRTDETQILAYRFTE